MFEGQNIHLSPIDGKRLCSFSRKLCKQRRLNGFAFCIRHILEDTQSPFKQCQFTIRSNGEQCFNPVPIDVERIYCSNHMQVLGLIPKTIKKHFPSKKSPIKNDHKSNLSTMRKEVLLKRKTTKKNLQIHDSQYLQNFNVDLRNRNIQKWRARALRKFNSRNEKLIKWHEQTFDARIESLKSTKTICSKQSYHVILQNDQLSNEDLIVNTYQKMFLTTHEQVHHNQLRADSISSQEHKVLSRLKHQCGQLKIVLKSKNMSGQLTYSVLSRLVAAARENPIETDKLILVAEPCQQYELLKKQNVKASYKIPCCMISSDVRCTKPALPYMKHCKDHVLDDTEQVLFSKPVNEPSRKSSFKMSLSFLKVEDSNSPSSLKLKSDVSIENTKQQKLIYSTKCDKVATHKGKTFKKKNALKERLKKQYSISTPINSKTNAHVKHTTKPLEEDPYLHDDNSVSCSTATSDTDSECDSLTPEEAFNLPPGSLTSFASQIDEDDPLSAMNGVQDMDEDDDELISCNANFSLGLRNHLSSPTLNQLSASEFDSAFNMLLSPTKDVTCDSVSTSSFCSPVLSKSRLSDRLITPVSSNLSSSANSSYGVTSLKIFPVTSNVKPISFNTGLLSKSMTEPFVSITDHVKTNGYQTHNCSLSKDSKTMNAWNKDLFTNSLPHTSRLNQSAFHDISSSDMDHSPFERVNPDIFFSSVFPVSTTTEDS